MLTIDNIKPKTFIHIENIKGHPNYPLHTHNFFECFLVLKGNAIHYHNDCYNLLLPGSFVIIRDGMAHSFLNSNNLEVININFFTNYWQKKSPLFIKYLNRIHSKFMKNNAHIYLTGQTLYKIHESLLHAEQEERDSTFENFKHNNLIISNMLYNVFLRIIRCRKCIQTPKDLESEKNLYHKQTIQDSIVDFVYFSDNFKQNIAVDVFATNRYCTYNTFLRKFKEYTGFTPKDIQIKLKLFHSINAIIQNRQKNIKDIACEVGFDDFAYFSKRFKKEFKLTPKEFQSMPKKLLTQLENTLS